MQCSVRDIWKNGLLWNIIKFDTVSDKEASPRHCDLFQQRHQLGWHHLDNSYLRSLRCRCSSWSLLDFSHCLSHLFIGTPFCHFWILPFITKISYDMNISYCYTQLNHQHIIRYSFHSIGMLFFLSTTIRITQFEI